LPLMKLAGFTWSFRRIVFSLPPRFVAPPGFPLQPYQDGADIVDALFWPYVLPHGIKGKVPHRLERIELRIGREREEEVRSIWMVRWSKKRFSEEGVRMAGMIWFVDEEDEDGTEGRRLVEE